MEFAEALVEMMRPNSNGILWPVAKLAAARKLRCANVAAQPAQCCDERVFQGRRGAPDAEHRNTRIGQTLARARLSAAGIAHHKVETIAKTLHVGNRCVAPQQLFSGAQVAGLDLEPG